MDVTVAGLPLVGENDILHPIAAVVCIKGLDADGDVAYWSRASEGRCRRRRPSAWPLAWSMTCAR